MDIDLKDIKFNENEVDELRFVSRTELDDVYKFLFYS